MSKSATSEWHQQAITGIAVAAPTLCLMLAALSHQQWDYEGAVAFVTKPLNLLSLWLLIGFGFYHGAHGMYVVIDDYIHHDLLRRLSLWAVNVSAFALALIGLLALLKITFGS